MMIGSTALAQDRQRPDPQRFAEEVRTLEGATAVGPRVDVLFAGVPAFGDGIYESPFPG